MAVSLPSPKAFAVAVAAAALGLVALPAYAEPPATPTPTATPSASPSGSPSDSPSPSTSPTASLPEVTATNVELPPGYWTGEDNTAELTILVHNTGATATDHGIMQVVLPDLTTAVPGGESCAPDQAADYFECGVPPLAPGQVHTQAFRVTVAFDAHEHEPLGGQVAFHMFGDPTTVRAVFTVVFPPHPSGSPTASPSASTSTSASASPSTSASSSTGTGGGSNLPTTGTDVALLVAGGIGTTGLGTLVLAAAMRRRRSAAEPLPD